MIPPRSIIIFSSLVLLATTISKGQAFILPNEDLIYSFETSNGKQLALVKDKSDKYIIYRFGSKTKIEFEFPEKNKSSFSKFKYSFYLRGGGPGNEGMDLNYVHFTNGNFQYVIFDNYVEKSEIGIKVVDLKSNKTTVIKGNTSTKKGTLIEFRSNGLLEIGEEIFD